MFTDLLSVADACRRSCCKGNRIMKKRSAIMESCWFLLIFLYGVLAENPEPCHTSSGKIGKCIEIRKCASLYAYVNKKTRSQADIQKLKQLHCGFNGEIPKVCCTDPDDETVPAISSRVLPEASVCGVDFGKRIHGGKTAELDEFPWMALLNFGRKNGRQNFLCGGSLISKRYVLTAAHCLRDKEHEGIRKLTSIRLGEYNKDSDEDCIATADGKECLQTPPIDVGVEEIITHEQYDPEDVDSRNDIALVRLERDVKFTDYIKPICMPVSESERSKSYAGDSLTVAGWGLTENGTSSSIKLKVVVPVKENSDCQNIYRYASKDITEKQICAGGEEGKDSCNGDSGGPLMAVSVDERGDTTWYIAGIVSYGPNEPKKPCAFEGWPAVYTRVSKYMGWIIRHMRT
ncbi:hypothetical protein HHI36_000519 [Cryptolaemus montrouzieri]|uniref:CLIP domain-containing serine protease n=1 Tax=Cryptolaemus montrouzieri TaxID=559131 RepID=A0ABD2P592_9CUCU